MRIILLTLLWVNVVAHAGAELRLLEATDRMEIYGKQGGGFVILDTDATESRVLAYSHTAPLDLQSGNPGLQWWLGAMQRVGARKAPSSL